MVEKKTEKQGMNNWNERTSLLVGDASLQALQQAHVLIVGVGGVGGYAAEMLCRAGIGQLTLIDMDMVTDSNINRQIYALHSTIGERKVDLAIQRCLDINPAIKIEGIATFITEETLPDFLAQHAFDFIVDAIDTLSPKCALIYEALTRKIPIISSMGSGAKKDITQVRFGDLWETYHCGLSRAVRKRFKRMKFRRKLPVVFSTEKADIDSILLVSEKNKKSTAGTISYMPAIFGCYLAEYVIRKLSQHD